MPTMPAKKISPIADPSLPHRDFAADLFHALIVGGTVGMVTIVLGLLIHAALLHQHYDSLFIMGLIAIPVTALVAVTRIARLRHHTFIKNTSVRHGQLHVIPGGKIRN